MGLVFGVGQLVGDLADGDDAACVQVRLVVEQRGDTAEVRLGADGQLDRGHGTVAVVQRSEYGVEVGPLAVHLVDEDHPGDTEVTRHLPDDVGLDLDAVHRAEHEDR